MKQIQTLRQTSMCVGHGTVSIILIRKNTWLMKIKLPTLEIITIHFHSLFHICLKFQIQFVKRRSFILKMVETWKFLSNQYSLLSCSSVWKWWHCKCHFIVLVSSLSLCLFIPLHVSHNLFPITVFVWSITLHEEKHVLLHSWQMSWWNKVLCLLLSSVFSLSFCRFYNSVLAL